MAKAKIPGGITPEEFMAVRKFLLLILKQSGSNQVIMRLNKTGERNPHPVFVGWVQDDALVKTRTQNDKNQPDPGLFRFGDTNYSKVYHETVYSGRGVIKERSWEQSDAEKDDHAKSLGPKAGVQYQRYIGIAVGDGKSRRCVGTVSVGFFRKPNTVRIKKRIDPVLRSWAVGADSDLIKLLKNNFAVGGPSV